MTSGERATLSEPERVVSIVESVGDDETIQKAYDIFGETLQSLNLSESPDEWMMIQELYFELKAALLARDPEFQRVDVPGTRVHVPSNPRMVTSNPIVDDTHGSVEVPTYYDSFRVMDSVTVAIPTNPHTKHQVHVDHVITPSGDVTVEIDGHDIDDIPV